MKEFCMNIRKKTDTWMLLLLMLISNRCLANNVEEIFEELEEVEGVEKGCCCKPNCNTPTDLTRVYSNIISSNIGDGIFITNNSSDNVVQNNNIGFDVTLQVPLGNTGDGVLIDVDSDSNLIGGFLTTQGNLIANNFKGVVVGDNVSDLSVGNSILSNSIFNNGTIGIDLANDGPTLNHATSPTAGPNDFQNYPILKSACKKGNTLSVKGYLQSVPSSTFLIQFFVSPSGNLQGKRLIGQTRVTTNAQGFVAFNAPIVNPILGCYVTSTATLLTTATTPSDTSEFSGAARIKSKK
jgi:hypothetical protein